MRFILDQDNRFENLVAVLMAERNHDMASSVWLRVMFEALYENESRVQVLDQPHLYYVYQNGQTLLGFHHGHLKKNDQLPLLFAAQFPKIRGLRSSDTFTPATGTTSRKKSTRG